VATEPAVVGELREHDAEIVVDGAGGFFCLTSEPIFSLRQQTKECDGTDGGLSNQFL